MYYLVNGLPGHLALSHSIPHGCQRPFADHRNKGIYVSHLTDGHTYQELLDPQSEPGEYYPKPNWVVYATKRDFEFERNEAGTELAWTFFLEEEGEYAIYIGGSKPDDLWFCAPLQVVEDPDE